LVNGRRAALRDRHARVCLPDACCSVVVAARGGGGGCLLQVDCPACFSDMEPHKCILLGDCDHFTCLPCAIQVRGCWHCGLRSTSTRPGCGC